MNGHNPENQLNIIQLKREQTQLSPPGDAISSNLAPESSDSQQHISQFSIDYHHIITQHILLDQLSSEQLSNSSITKQNRARLKFWLSQECSRGGYTRQTYGAACKYLDTYIAKNRIELNSFQALGLACFLLAAKVIERKPPPISFQVFNKAQILNYQKEIFVTLKFYVQPLTYVKIADILFLQWDIYYQLHFPPYELNYFKDTENSIKCYQSMLQILDSINLVPEVFDVEIPSLVMSLFFFEHRMNCQGGPHPRTTEQAFELLGMPDRYQKMFERFYQFVRAKCEVFENAQFTQEVMDLMVPFLSLETRVQRILPSHIPAYGATYAIHTHNPNSFALAKSRMVGNRRP